MKLGYYKWFHVPNGGMRNAVVAAKLKAQGTKAGVLDVIIIKPPEKHPDVPGVVIELKRVKGGVVSPEQKKWLESFTDERWLTYVAKGCGEAIDIVEKLYGK